MRKKPVECALSKHRDDDVIFLEIQATRAERQERFPMNGEDVDIATVAKAAEKLSLKTVRFDIIYAIDKV